MLFTPQKDEQMLSSLTFLAASPTPFIPDERTDCGMNHIRTHTAILSFYIMIHPSVCLSSQK